MEFLPADGIGYGVDTIESADSLRGLECSAEKTFNSRQGVAPQWFAVLGSRLSPYICEQAFAVAAAKVSEGYFPQSRSHVNPRNISVVFIRARAFLFLDLWEISSFDEIRNRHCRANIEGPSIDRLQKLSCQRSDRPLRSIFVGVMERVSCTAARGRSYRCAALYRYT